MQILFVDDNAMNRRVVGEMLRAAALTMAEAEDAETGLAMIEANDYDLVLMDLRMPGMDGMTAVRKIRERRDAKGKLPVIIVTADASANLRQECVASGADEFLMKPVAMDDLFDTISKVLEEKQSEEILL